MEETAAVLPRLSDFTRMLKKTFRAGRPGRDEFEAELVEVDQRRSDDRQENFTLLFRAPIDVPSEQGTYEMHTEGEPTMSIFLVPVSKDDRGLYFEAVFNTFVA
jgi:hypothetical protein